METKKKKIEDDKLIVALGRIMDELKEKYDFSNTKIMNLLIRELRKKYRIKRKDILEIIKAREY